MVWAALGRKAARIHCFALSSPSLARRGFVTEIDFDTVLDGGVNVPSSPLAVSILAKFL